MAKLRDIVSILMYFSEPRLPVRGPRALRRHLSVSVVSVVPMYLRFFLAAQSSVTKLLLIIEDFLLWGSS